MSIFEWVGKEKGMTLSQAVSTGRRSEPIWMSENASGGVKGRIKNP